MVVRKKTQILMHVLIQALVAAPFLHFQRSTDSFMLIGADLLPDDHGGLWLLELNCPPCMGAYTVCVCVCVCVRVCVCVCV